MDQFLVEQSSFGEMHQFLVEQISSWRNRSVFGGTDQFLEKWIRFWRNEKVKVAGSIFWWRISVFGHESMINLKDLFKSSLLALYNCFGELLPSAKHRL